MVSTRGTAHVAQWLAHVLQHTWHSTRGTAHVLQHTWYSTRGAVVSTRAFHLCDPGSIPARCSYQIKIPPWSHHSHVRRVFPV